MIISGVKIEKDNPEKRKIINSWAEKDKNLKFYIADDNWIEKYVSCVIINKSNLNEKELNLLNEKPVIIDKWNNKIN